jgi:hypothetical protein
LAINAVAFYIGLIKIALQEYQRVSEKPLVALLEPSEYSEVKKHGEAF